MGKARTRNEKRKRGMVAQRRADAQRVCGAPKKNGKPCLREAGWGTDHPGRGGCKTHGGASPSHRVKARRDEMIERSTPRSTTPGMAIQRVLNNFNGDLDYADRRLAEAELEDADVNLLLTPWYAARRRASKDLLDAAIKAVAAGVAERNATTAEENSRLFAIAIEETMSAIGLTDAQRRKLGPAIRSALPRVIEGSVTDEAAA